jgi:polysaccharide export outer membrane protein
MTGRSVTLALVIGALAVSACVQAPKRIQAPVRADAQAAARAPGPAATDASAAAQADALAADYRLGPGDTVKISVYNNPDLSAEVEVSRAGKINFPLVGEVAVGGLTRTEAERVIAQRLDAGGFVPKAHVNILVSQYRSQQVSVLGEVRKPGMYPLSQSATLTDLLAAAGGITEKGSSVVTVIRKEANGTAQRYQVDVDRMLAAGDMSKNFTVAAEDIIHVAPMPVFYIYGEVRRPGAYPLVPNMTVQQAISTGGGLTVRGSERGIRVDRQAADGKVTRLRASGSDRLRPNDVISVPESWF